MQGKITKRIVDALKPGSQAEFLWDDGLPGFGIKITPENRRVYLIQYRMGGRGFPTRRYTIGKHGEFTPEKARERAQALLQGVRDGIDPMGEKATARVNTVRKLVDEFIKSRRDKGRRSADEVEWLLKREVVAAWGDRPVASITRADVVRLLDTITERGAGTLANRTLAHIKTMFAWAEGRGTLMASPAKGIEKPSAEISRDRTPNNAELVEIWRAADSLGWPFGKAVQLLILTGQRREEVSGMAWSEIKFDTATWSIPAARSKNALAHDVHLSSAAFMLLRSLPRFVEEHPNEVDLIFTTTGNTSISGWGKAKRKLDAKILEARQNTAKEAGTDPLKVKPMEAWTLHDLRRSVATGMNDLGVLPHVADRILNHASAKKGGVMAVYNRAEYAGERKAAMSLWAEHLERLLSRNTARIPPIGRLAHGE